MGARELVVVEVRARGLVRAADVDHGDARVGQVLGGRLTPLDGTAVESDQDAHGQEVVLVRAARVGDDESDGVHGGGGSQLRTMPTRSCPSSSVSSFANSSVIETPKSLPARRRLVSPSSPCAWKKSGLSPLLRSHASLRRGILGRSR